MAARTPNENAAEKLDAQNAVENLVQNAVQNEPIVVVDNPSIYINFITMHFI